MEQSAVQRPPTTWERWNEWIVAWVPYLTLALSTALSLPTLGDTWTQRIVILGLVAVAARVVESGVVAGGCEKSGVSVCGSGYGGREVVGWSRAGRDE